jgi:hypothetical protein
LRFGFLRIFRIIFLGLRRCNHRVSF